MNEMDRLPANAYQPQITDQIYDTLVQHASRILVQGYSVVVDAVFAREAERAAIREAALKQNIRFAGFFLATDLTTRQSRVGRRKGDASDATPEPAFRSNMILARLIGTSLIPPERRNRP
jgi:predicted kinase